MTRKSISRNAHGGVVALLISSAAFSIMWLVSTVGAHLSHVITGLQETEARIADLSERLNENRETVQSRLALIGANLDHLDKINDVESVDFLFDDLCSTFGATQELIECNVQAHPLTDMLSEYRLSLTARGALSEMADLTLGALQAPLGLRSVRFYGADANAAPRVNAQFRIVAVASAETREAASDGTE